LGINEFWDIQQLEKKVRETLAKMKQRREETFIDENGNAARMIEMISPNSYHQAEEITGFFEMGYEQSSMNENEVEALNWAVKMKIRNTLEELATQIKLPRAFSFSFDYDPDGNFGLILYRIKKKNDINTNPEEDLKKRISFQRFRFWLRSQYKTC
jgi:hypothetical protein